MTTSEHRYVKVADLQVDPTVQGVRRERRVKIMAAAWDPRASNTITVSLRRNGAMFVIDGQHRVAAALETQDRPERVVNGITLPATHKVHELYAEVIEGLSLEDEAELFLLLNDTKVPMATDRVAVAAVAGHPDAMKVEIAGNKYGWYLRKPPAFRASGTIHKIAAMDESGEILDRVLNIITQAWAHDPDSTRANIIDGLARLIQKWPHVDDERLIKVLGRIKPATILANIEGLRPTYAVRARMVAISGLYDKGLSDTRKLGL